MRQDDPKKKHLSENYSPLENSLDKLSLDSDSWLKVASAAPSLSLHQVFVPIAKMKLEEETENYSFSTLEQSFFQKTQQGEERYQVEGELTRGGMGRILRGQDKKLGRPVAVKELLFQGSKRSRERFLREALIIAKLEHPSIVPIHDVGRWENGTPYYAMKLVDGRSLREVLEEKTSLQERLSLLPHLLDACEAVAYAHENQIIHRDLKPQNILIGSFGETVVIDWGIAKDLQNPQHFSKISAGPYRKPTKPSMLTQEGDILGTPAYMPPEQAEGKEVDKTADVYALGAILYHLLSGKPPYQGKESQKILSLLRERSPVPLEKQEPKVPKDLLCIVKKAMKRVSRARYSSAKELAKDLRKFQAGQLIESYDYSIWERSRHFLQRNRSIAMVTSLAIFALFMTVSLSFSQILEEKKQARLSQKEAEIQRDEARKAQTLADSRTEKLTYLQAKSVLEKDPTSTLAWLKQLPPNSSYWNAARLLAEEAYQKGIAQTILQLPTKSAHRIQFLPDGKHILSLGFDGTIRLWDHEKNTNQVLFEVPQDTSHQHEDFKQNIPLPTWFSSTRFSRDGKQFAFVYYDEIYLWNVENAKSRPLLHPTLTNQYPNSRKELSFSPDGKLIALYETIDESGVKKDGIQFPGPEKSKIWLWNTETEESYALPDQEGILQQLVFSSDCTKLTTLHKEESKQGKLFFLVRVWDLAEKTHQTIPVEDLSNLRSQDQKQVMLSPDGSYLSYMSFTTPLYLFHIKTKKKWVPSSSTLYRRIEFSPDNRFLVGVGIDKFIHIFSLESKKLIHFLPQHSTEIQTIKFSPDSKFLAFISSDKTALLWRMEEKMQKEYAILPTVKFSMIARTFQGHQEGINDIAFSSDSSMFATASRDKTIRVWKTEDRNHIQLAYDFKAPARSNAFFSPDQTKVAIVFHVYKTQGGQVYTNKIQSIIDVYQVKTGKKLQRFYGPENVSHLEIQFSKDSTRLLTNYVSFSEQSTSENPGVFVWDLHTKERFILQIRDRDLLLQVRNDSYESKMIKQRATFSPDGTLVASSISEQGLYLWDISTRTYRILQGDQTNIVSFDFSPNGNLLATASTDQTVRIWNLSNKTNRVLAQNPVDFVKFSPDGKFLLFADLDRVVYLWNVNKNQGGPFLDRNGSKEKILQELKIISGFSVQPEARIAFSPDSRFVAFVGEDFSVKLWELETKIVHELVGEGTSSPSQVGFSPNNTLWVSYAGRKIKQWDVDTLESTMISIGDYAVKKLGVSPHGDYAVVSSETLSLWKPQIPKTPEEILDWLEKETSAIIKENGQVDTQR